MRKLLAIAVSRPRDSDAIKSSSADFCEQIARQF